MENTGFKVSSVFFILSTLSKILCKWKGIQL